jgi:hypothetical protein
LRTAVRTEPVEIYDDTSNFAILRHPGRRFPGSLIQGDSLSILVGEARWLLKRVSKSEDRTLVAAAREHLQNLQARLEHYEKVLAEHDIELPYAKRNDT